MNGIKAMWSGLLALLASALVLGSSSALAVAPDYTPLTSAVDFAGVNTSMFTVAAAVMGVTIVLIAIGFIFKIVHKR